MELPEKKEMIFRLIKTGMRLDEAYLVSECTDEEIELLKGDDKFKRELKYHRACEEKALLSYYNDAMITAASKGRTGPLVWMLNRVNPNSYGEKDSADNAGSEDVIVYLPENNR